MLLGASKFPFYFKRPSMDLLNFIYLFYRKLIKISLRNEVQCVYLYGHLFH